MPFPRVYDKPLPNIEASSMKTVLSFFALLAAFILCLSNAFAQAYMQEHLPEGAKARIGRGGVYELAYSVDGRQLAAASAIGIWIYDARIGEAFRLLTGHTSYVSSVAFSPDGSTLASGSYDNTIRLWDIRTGTHLKTLTEHTGSVRAVMFSPDGTMFASGSGDNTLRVLDVETGELLYPPIVHSADVMSLAYSPDGNVLASGNSNSRVYLRDAQTGKDLRTLIGHTRYARCIAYSPDGKTLASGSYDGTVLLWDLTQLYLSR